MGQLICLSRTMISFSAPERIVAIDTFPPIWDSTWVDKPWIDSVDTFPPWWDTIQVKDTIRIPSEP
jgi:hypothetical protein